MQVCEFKLGTSGVAQTVLKAVESGEIDLALIIPSDADLTGFAELSPRQREMLEIKLELIRNDQRHRREDLGKRFYVGESTVKTHLGQVYRKTGSCNLIHALCGYLAWKQRGEPGQGEPDPTLAETITFIE